MGAGDWSALIADAAEEPGPVDAMGWGRAVLIPAMGSVLVAGHNPLGALFLRAAHAASLAAPLLAPLIRPLSTPFADAVPFGWDAADTVEAVEACEEREPDEFCRCALFLGMKTPPPFGVSPFHECRLRVDWYETGCCTAVVISAAGEAGVACVSKGPRVGARGVVRDGSDAPQALQTGMRREWVRAAGGEREQARPGGCRVLVVEGARATAGEAALQTGAEHGSTAWSVSLLLRGQPRGARCDGRWEFGWD